MPFEADFQTTVQSQNETEALCTVKVPADLKFFDGHFPGDPIVPGVAQVVAIAEEAARNVWPSLPETRGLRRVKFTLAIRPNDEVVLRLERKADRVAFRMFKNEELCSRGSILLAE